ncbi:hypothetical protein VTO42DRAFT_5635 [Malbranchea cinnamomea]
MIGATKRWFRRHQNGLFIGAGILGAGYLAGQYVISKISETKERMSSERIARENLRRRFEQNQSDCTFTVLALLPTATDNILKALPVEELTNELQQKRAQRLARLNAGEVTGSEMSSGPPSVTDDDGRSLSSFVHTNQTGESTILNEGQKTKSRTQLWNELKINSLTRSFTLLYTLALLTLLTRIQLNLLGRLSYLSSVVSLAKPSHNPSIISLEDDEDIEHAFGNDYETNRRYLTFSWWLLHRGWADLMEKVKAAVVEVFGPVNPREDLSQERLSELTLAVRKKVEGATSEERRSMKWLPYLMPPSELENYVLQESGVLSDDEPAIQNGSSLRRLLDETSDLIDSPSFTHVLSLLNNEAFSHLIDKKCAAEAFKVPPSQPATQTPDLSSYTEDFTSSATIVPVNKPAAPKAKLATILAVISRQAHSIGNGNNPPNEYLVAMEQGVRELAAFAAVVYSSNFGLESSIPRPDAAKEPTVASPAPPPETSQTGRGTQDASSESTSIVDLGRSSGLGGGDQYGFEQAWGKAVEGSP